MVGIVVQGPLRLDASFVPHTAEVEALTPMCLAEQQVLQRNLARLRRARRHAYHGLRDQLVDGPARSSRSICGFVARLQWKYPPAKRSCWNSEIVYQVEIWAAIGQGAPVGLLSEARPRRVIEETGSIAAGCVAPSDI